MGLRPCSCFCSFLNSLLYRRILNFVKSASERGLEGSVSSFFSGTRNITEEKLNDFNLRTLCQTNRKRCLRGGAGRRLRPAPPRPRPLSAPLFPSSPRLPAFLPGSPSAHIGAPQDGGWQWGEVSAPYLSLPLFKLAPPCQRPGAQSLSFFPLMQPESEVFEITDFTTASEWERWVSRIIGYQQFGPRLRPATSPTLTTSDATSAGKVSPLAPRSSPPPFCGPPQASSTSDKPRPAPICITPETLALRSFVFLSF